VRKTVEGRDVEITHPGKVLFPDLGFTKADLADYYEKVAGVLVPHARGRPVSLHRYPDGLDGGDFFQKNVSDYFPGWISTVEVKKEGGTVEHLLIDGPAVLVYLAGQACITPHLWLARADRPHHPDRMIFDLDPPGEEVPSGDAFTPVREAARALCDLLRELGLEPFLMTTGSRGLHVTVPLDREADFDRVRTFARRVADHLAGRHPDRWTTEQRKDKRRGRLFLDTMRNAYAQTGVAPYALRARPGAPVATPLHWSELDAHLHPRRYHAGNLFRRLAQKEDPWKKIDRSAHGLEKAEARLEEAVKSGRTMEEIAAEESEDGDGG